LENIPPLIGQVSSSQTQNHDQENIKTTQEFYNFLIEQDKKVLKQLGRLSELQNKISQMTTEQQTNIQTLIDSIYSSLAANISSDDTTKVGAGIDLLAKLVDMATTMGNDNGEVDSLSTKIDAIISDIKTIDEDEALKYLNAMPPAIVTPIKTKIQEKHNTELSSLISKLGTTLNVEEARHAAADEAARTANGNTFPASNAQQNNMISSSSSSSTSNHPLIPIVSAVHATNHSSPRVNGNLTAEQKAPNTIAIPNEQQITNNLKAPPSGSQAQNKESKEEEEAKNRKDIISKLNSNGLTPETLNQILSEPDFTDDQKKELIKILNDKITLPNLQDPDVFNQLVKVIAHLNTDENKTHEIQNLINKLSSDTNNISKLDPHGIQTLARIAAENLDTPAISKIINKMNEEKLDELNEPDCGKVQQLQKIEYFKSHLLNHLTKDTRGNPNTTKKEENHLKTANLALTKMKYNWIKKNQDDKTHETLYKTYQSAFEKILDEQKNKLNQRYENIKMLINQKQLKVIDYLTSPKIVSMIVFKLIVYALVAAATAAAVKSFTKLYTQRVYTQNQAPPPLTQMLGIFLAYCLTFVGILFALLWAAGQVAVGPIFHGPDSIIELIGEYYINDHLFSFVLDFLIFITALSIITLVFVLFLEDRRFFRYQTEGLRAARVTRDILLSVGAFLIVWPYFLILF
jgi:hypothetical protein